MPRLLQNIRHKLGMDPQSLALPKPRNFKDFILGGEYYKLPQGLNEWNKRLCQNLIFYQTNYLIGLILCLLPYAYYDFWKFMGMAFSVILTGGSAYLGVKNREELRNFQTGHPCMFLGILFVISFLIIYMLKSTAVFLWAVFFPTFVFMVHASFRILNFGNSVDREQTRVASTYMGALLKALDLISDNVFD